MIKLYGVEQETQQQNGKLFLFLTFEHRTIRETTFMHAHYYELTWMMPTLHIFSLYHFIMVIYHAFFGFSNQHAKFNLSWFLVSMFLLNIAFH